MEQQQTLPTSPNPMSGKVALYAALCALLCATLLFPTLDRGAFGINLPLSVLLVYTAFFLAMRANGSRVHINNGWPLFFLIPALSLPFAIYNVPEILLLDLLALIVLIPNHLVLLAGGNTWQLRDTSFVGKVASELFIRPFAYMAAGCRATLTGRGDRARTKTFLMIAAGLAVAVPLAGILILLLAAADERFSQLLEGLFRHFDLAQVVIIGFMAALAFFPLLGFVCSLARGQKTVAEQKTPPPGGIHPVAVGAFLALVNLILAAFALLQLGRIFGPAFDLSGSDYSRYAHDGFFPMLAAAILCFLVQALCLRFTKRQGNALPIRLLTSLMGVSLVVMMISAMQAILRYQAAMGLSRLRIYVTLCIATLFLWLILTLIKIWTAKIPYRALVCGLLAAALVGLNYMNVDARIAANNIAMLREDALDTGYLLRLSADAWPALAAAGIIRYHEPSPADVRLWNYGRRPNQALAYYPPWPDDPHTP